MTKPSEIVCIETKLGEFEPVFEIKRRRRVEKRKDEERERRRHELHENLGVMFLALMIGVLTFLPEITHIINILTR